MTSQETNREGIAIVGMAGRFPKAANIEQFWRNLCQGVEAISFFSDEELEEAGIGFPKGNPNYIKARGVLENADCFDASFFGINPKEAEIMDPQHRVFLECAWEALENAGCDPARTESLIGVFAGMSMNTYLLSNLATHPELLELVGHHQVMLANDKDFLPTRVSYKFNLKGPSISIGTACSTSLVAVCVACQNLLSYQCDIALAGGVSITFPQKKGYLFQEGGIVSADGHCRTFDARAQGTVAGEGAGVVVLKRAAEALADGDNIYATIKGWGINNDGSSKIGYTAPSEDGQAEVIALAQAVAGFEPETIRYVVAHGTGTPLGDPIEVAGLSKAFRAGTDAKGFCALTSVKTNIGHLDAAAGIAGLINATLAVQHRRIPPSLHFEKPNPKIDFANSPFFVNPKLLEWEEGPAPRRAGVSSFGIGGTNAHVVLEEAPAADPSASSRPAQLLLLSAKTPSALETAARNLASCLKAHPELALADVAYTLQVGRRSFNHRRMLVCGTLSEAAAALEETEPKPALTRIADDEKRPVVFMFPGQGAQHVNMGLELYQSEPVFREHLDLCANSLQPHLGLDLRALLYPKPEQLEHAKTELSQAWLAQPAIFAIEYALAKLWMSWGIVPHAMIGHSAGEFVAACVAGVFSLKDALGLVAARARLVQEQPAGSMLAVRLEEPKLQPLLDGMVSIATVNSPTMCVVSGPTDEIEALQHRLKGQGVPSQRLQSSHAFHSAMIEPVVLPLTELIKRITLKPPSLPYISGLTGQWITSKQAQDPAYWGCHLRQTMRFSDGVRNLLMTPGQIFLEVGPGQGLTSLVRQHPGSENAAQILSSLPLSQSQQNEPAVMLQALGQIWLSGKEVNWSGFYNQEKRRKVPLPTYPFERQRFWIEPAKTTLQAQPRTTISRRPNSQPSAETKLASSVSPVARETASGQRDSIAARLEALLSELSGLNLKHTGGTKTFIEMGLDSLFLTQASQAIEQRFGVRIAFADLLEKFSTFELLTEHLNRTIPADRNLTGAPAPVRPLRAENSGTVRIGAHGEVEGVLTVPLTEAQKELWYGTLLGDKASCVFNESVVLRLHGAFDPSAMRRAVQHLVDLHEALRTSISASGEEQQIFPSAKIEVPLLDFSTVEPSRREGQFQDVMAEAAAEAFDLYKPPLLRCRMVKMESELYYVVFVIHHIVCDGRSMLILMDELADFYSREHQGVAVDAARPMQFSEYARAHARTRGSSQQLADAAFWLKQFSNVPAELELPSDRPRPSKLAFNAAKASQRIDSKIWQDLKRLSAQHGCTQFTVLLAAYYILLHRLSGQDDIVVGVPIAVREGIEKLVGHCVNFLPLRGRIRGNPIFSEFLVQVRKDFVEAFSHQNYTFGSLIQELNLPRNPSRMPLVSVTCNLARGRTLNMSQLEAKLLSNPNCFTNFDLTFDLLERDGEQEASCTYSTDLFDAQTIQRWLGHFCHLLGEIASNPAKRVGALSLLLAAECDQLRLQWDRHYLKATPPQRLNSLSQGASGRILILDAYNQPAPIGVPGELHFELDPKSPESPKELEPTKESRLSLPFGDGAARRILSTGERVRFCANGQMEFLGPLDRQLKIRGFRIEPAEIESALAQHSEVRECVATSLRDSTGKLELAAFVVLKNGKPAAARELREFLASKLPDYMVPSRFAFLEELPLLPGGMVDRSKLILPPEEALESDASAARPCSETEKILSEIWKEVIGLKEVRPHDNFFELGGHSVLVTQIIARVRKVFQVDLSLRTVFESPTVAALAAEIEKALIEEIEQLPEEEAQLISKETAVSSKEGR